MLPGGRTVVAFRRRILALGRGNLQMSWYKCPGIPRDQSPGMAADKCISEKDVFPRRSADYVTRSYFRDYCIECLSHC